MGIQFFLNIGNICHSYFRDMGYFSKQFKGYWILGPPSRASKMSPLLDIDTKRMINMSISVLFFILSAGSKAQIRNTPPECLPQAFQARIAKCLPINMQNLTEAEVAVAHICK